MLDKCFQSVTISIFKDLQYVNTNSHLLLHGAVKDYYLRMATVKASEELAHGQITSGRSPRA